MTREELHVLTGEVERSNLAPEVRDKIIEVFKTIDYLLQVIEDKSIAVGRLVRMIFGRSTESSKNILVKPDEEDSSEGSDGSACQDKDKKKKPVKGHGRNGTSAYAGAEKILISHSTLKAGFPCPLCLKGKVYKLKSPGKVVRFVGSPPVKATVYELEKLRCNLCGEIFTADLPKEAGEKKYDETAGAMIALLKDGSGFPFYRFEKLQASLGIPLPASTQWDVVEDVAHQIYPVFEELKREAAQGEVVYNDDTTMKILFVDVQPYFPQECENVLKTLGKVYKNDETAKEQNMSPEERLSFHQSHSGPLMNELHQWLKKQFDEKKVEPNSSLGKEISYMQNHWEKLTRFLEVPGAPPGQ